MSDKPCREERAAVDAAAAEESRLFFASRLPEPSEIAPDGTRIIRLTAELWATMQDAEKRYPAAHEKWLEALETFSNCMDSHR